ncbi:MAG: Lar family restriction alleviation protein [Adlercreutzia sp.]|uniref:Lar family restriction alleviation protein n=1 Tax=Adlercreutzia sp. TaxID=1872387 RepID=UPI002EA2C1D6|nr:Lar family restriction alleviation protein [Adlercreutzia sp.]MEE0308421.1 Lar family restriction alleviation protein [Adlercreutzia sp.]
MSDELKRCPFCGGKPTFVHATSEDIGNGYVCRTLAVISCDHCMFDMTGETDEKAAAAWNARAAVTDEQFAIAVHDGEAWQRVRECRNIGCETGDDFKCSACGEAYNESDDMAMPASRIDWCFSCGAKVVG